jgi:hypothetical protein
MIDLGVLEVLIEYAGLDVVLFGFVGGEVEPAGLAGPANRGRAFGLYAVGIAEGYNIFEFIAVHAYGRDELAVVVHASGALGGVLDAAEGGEQDRDEQGDDADDDKKFNERKCGDASVRGWV